MLEMLGIKKTFGANRVLHGVDFRVEAGAIHGLIGHNGAGKSTLMKILQGVHEPDEGVIKIGGSVADYKTPAQARAAGVGMVFQEFSLIPTLTVSQNVCLGSLGKNPLTAVNDSRSRAVAERLFEELGVSIDPLRPVSELSTAEQQFTEIAKALSEAQKVLVLDEPTAALTGQETEQLFATLRELARKGLSIVFISHRLAEVVDLCQDVTVLRDGRVALRCATSETDVRGLVAAMLGTSAKPDSPRQVTSKPAPTTAPTLEVKDLVLGPHPNPASFSAYPGQVLGLIGLLGSGIDDVADALFGVHGRPSGEVRVNDQPLRLRHPADAVRVGMALVPSDNRHRGLVGTMNLEANISLTILKRLRRWFGLDISTSSSIARDYIRELGIKAEGIRADVTTLSGGNQRKVVVAKALATNSEILVFHEATAGVDVGAADEIKEIARQAAAAGRTVLWISSIFEEVIELADRILTIRNGVVSDEFDNSSHSISEEELVHAVQ
jgi:ribose transport system ATP-binding protein